jgi:hypothetical protein
LRLFRYEIRRWRHGWIPDVEEAVDSPRRLTDDEALAQCVLALVPEVPTAVWGRDELGTGDMWNSNSVIAWVLALAGIDAASIEPPAKGRAPGWRAGVVVAGRHGDAKMRGRSRQSARPLAPGTDIAPSLRSAPMMSVLWRGSCSVVGHVERPGRFLIHGFAARWPKTSYRLKRR